MKLYTKFLFVCSLFCLGACSWLDIEPEGEATSDKLFSSGDGIRSVLSGVYKQMTSPNLYGRELQFGLIDCVSQQYTWNWNTGSMGETSKNIYKEAMAYNYKYVELRKLIDAIWADGYNVIANANNLIQTLPTVSLDVFAGGEMERDMILGEAYACRGLMHFDLCRAFAPAPVANEGGLYLPYVDTYPDIQPMGIEVKPYLEKVVADLEKARQLTEAFDLSAQGQCVSATYRARYMSELPQGMGMSKDDIDDFYWGRGFRLSHYAITAVLARVYQYMGNDEKAFEYADKVLSFKAKGVSDATYEMFANEEWAQQFDSDLERRENLKVPSNLIFALYNEDAYEDYDLGSYFQKKGQGGTAGKWFVINYGEQGFFKHPTTGDLEIKSDSRGKYLLFTPQYQFGYEGDAYYVSAKGYASEISTVRQNNVQILPVIRSTEMRYIKAECLAKKGNFAEAYSILNEIRNNRFAGAPLNEQNTLEGFINDLVNDAQREFLSEGQLFYLYKRLGYKIKIGREVREMNKSEYMFPIPVNQNM